MKIRGVSDITLYTVMCVLLAYKLKLTRRWNRTHMEVSNIDDIHLTFSSIRGQAINR